MNRGRCANHARACDTDTKLIVKFTTPPMPEPQPGDVVVIHPAHERFLNWLAELWWKDRMRRTVSGPTGDDAPREPEPTEPKAAKRSRSRAAPSDPRQEPDYEVITADEAIARYGMTRDEIMARFDALSDVAVVRPSRTQR